MQDASVLLIKKLRFIYFIFFSPVFKLPLTTRTKSRDKVIISDNYILAHLMLRTMQNIYIIYNNFPVRKRSIITLSIVIILLSFANFLTWHHVVDTLLSIIRISDIASGYNWAP